MTQASRKSITAGGFHACERFQPSDDAVAEAWQAGDTTERPPAARRLLRVLVADDDRDTADSACLLVKTWRHDVRPAYNGPMALELASTYQPDVLLLDLAMPGMDGYELARQLRRQPRFQDSLVIALTGYADQAHRRLSEEAGFDLFLIKPVEPLTLEMLLLLEQARLAESPEAPAAAPRAYGILVVDDEECVRGVLNAGLRPEGFAVWLAADGREALDLYRRHQETIDVVLLDVRMPGLDGPHVLAALQKLNPQVRCCFMSGGLGRYTAEGLRNLGAATVLSKPFHLDEVAQVLWKLASKAELSPSGT